MGDLYDLLVIGGGANGAGIIWSMRFVIPHSREQRPAHEREARFLRRTEWARTPDDVLHRRAKHCLHLSPAEQDGFAAWCARSA